MNTRNFLDRFRVTVPQLEQLVRTALARGGDYSDLYFEYTVYQDLLLKDGEVASGGFHIDYGTGIRVLKGERTGYAYSENTGMADMTAAAEAAAQEYADAAEAAAKAADPTDLLLTDRLLQLMTNGEAIGEGVQIPDTGEKFELICDETLQETVNSITITQTPDGSSLNIKKLFVAASITTVNENGLVMLNFNGGNMYLMYRNFDTDANTTKTIWCYVEKIAPGVFRSVYPTTMLTATSLDSIQGLGTANRELSGAICCFGQNPANYFAKATRVTFGATSNLYSLQSGSRVMMWAVMDKDE